MLRYFSEISYKGSNYHGWQKQKNAPSIQSEIENALSKLLRTAILTTGSGRTDTGVHALQQFFHFDSNKNIHPQDLAYKLNAILNKDIAIKNIYRVSDEAHTRYNAISRSYIYKIHHHKNPFLQEFSYHISRKLDVFKMNEACELLIGEKDFRSFSRVRTQVNDFFCNVLSAKWVVQNDTLEFHISANRFLRGMVRAIVGTLLLIGEGKIDLKQFKTILEAKDRKKAGRAVPAHGLYLARVVYPDNFFK